MGCLYGQMNYISNGTPGIVHGIGSNLPFCPQPIIAACISLAVGWSPRMALRGLLELLDGSELSYIQYV
jgi:hypothetical protein